MSRTFSAGPAIWTVLLALCAPLSAQLGPGNPLEGLELRVRVTLEHDVLMKRSARIQLLTLAGVAIREAFTNQEGWAVFPRMGAGEFRLDVSGDGIERFVTGTFTIYRQERQHLEFIQVRSKNDGDHTDVPGSVAAASLSVPAAAKKEYEEGSRAFSHREWPKASKHFERATVLYPEYSLAYNAMGVVYLKTGDRELARQSFEKAISIEQLAPAYVNLAKIAFQDKKYDETESLLLKSFSNDPGTPEALTLLAFAELLSGKYDEAVANARKVHSIPHKGYASAHYLAARALEAKNLPAEAVEEYKTFLQEAPDDPNATRAREALARLQK